MDIQRKAYSQLLQWKNATASSKAILIKGARRVGKSYLAEAFAKKEYASYILIDFASPLSGTKAIFEKYGNRQNLNELFNQLSVLYGTALTERKSVFIFDEIQKYPKARELIKYLVADGRYDFIETGSLISINKNVKDIVIPSEEEEMFLHPLDFEEYLSALSDAVSIPFLREAYQANRPLGNMLKPMMDKLRGYMLVGGMPQAVAEYATSGNIDRVERVKRGMWRKQRRFSILFHRSWPITIKKSSTPPWERATVFPATRTQSAGLMIPWWFLFAPALTNPIYLANSPCSPPS